MDTSSPVAYLQVDALQNVQGLLAGAVVLVDVVQLDHVSDGSDENRTPPGGRTQAGPYQRAISLGK